jgi:signal transduction histidine kinase
MKLFIIIIGWLLVHTISIGQQGLNTDSLKRLLSATSQDTNRVDLLKQLASEYGELNPDTTIKLLDEALKLAKQLEDLLREHDCRLAMELFWWRIGDYSTAIKLALENVELAERLKDNYLIEINCLILTSSYRDQGDYHEALTYSFKGTYLSTKFNNCSRCGFWHAITASNYLGMNMPDSSLFYLRQANLYDYDDQKGWVYLITGKTYALLSEYDSAYYYYQLSIKTLIGQNNSKDLAGAYHSIAKLFETKNKIDSAIHYAQNGLSIAEKNHYNKELLETNLLLSLLYEKTNIKDALYYYKMAMAAKDSLFNREKIKQLLSSEYNAELRQQELKVAQEKYNNKVRVYALIALLAGLLVIAGILWRNNRHKQKANLVLQKQKAEIQSTLSELKTTQSLLIQSEKMASLGELTAGIAHEIQNPLNFVNNFSAVNSELIEELTQEIDKGNLAEVKLIASDIRENEDKITHHGKRADAIVKGMLQHSRTPTGQKEPTDINALADEYLRLSYHGLRAKDKSFNATTNVDFDNAIGKINIIPQDIGRVLLNLYNNAFYAVSEKQTHSEVGYEPIVSVNTRKTPDRVEIEVTDNGNGIPGNILGKIFQPFFTTKPTGQGTGLGLSLSYDVIRSHGGELKVESKEGEGSKFIIQLPT